MKKSRSFFSLPVALWLLIGVVYLPFLGTRVIRMAGDEKTYLGQALEMSERSTWFLQTYLGESNYYKGPLHYIAVIFGLKVFGLSLWAALFMNAVGLAAASAALGLAVKRSLKGNPAWGFWAGAAWLTCSGIYAYSFASQMELELAALFAVALALLEGGFSFSFWCVAGLAGWLKSPLHSVLIGAAAILFWTLQGQLKSKLKNPREWRAIVAGIAICGLGYAPAYFWDREAFVRTYIHRETFDKPTNYSPWWVPILPLLTSSLLPWIAVVWMGLYQWARIDRRRAWDAGARRLACLGFSFVCVSVAFFLWHPYRVSHYNLPVTCGLIVIAAAAASQAHLGCKVWRTIWLTPAFILTVLGALVTAVFLRIPAPEGHWPWVAAVLIWVGAIAAAVMAWRSGGSAKGWGARDPATGAAATAGAAALSFVGIGILLVWLGHADMKGLNEVLERSERNGAEIHVDYLNLTKSVWNEWGLMAFTLGRRVHSLGTPEELRQALLSGDFIVSTEESGVYEVRRAALLGGLTGQLEVIPWKRWRSKGRDDQGRPLWRSAWSRRDANVLRGDYFILRWTNSAFANGGRPGKSSNPS